MVFIVPRFDFCSQSELVFALSAHLIFCSHCSFISCDLNNACCCIFPLASSPAARALGSQSVLAAQKRSVRPLILLRWFGHC
jgi:hypothetical protein